MDQLFFKRGADQPPFSDEVCVQAFEPARPYPQNPLAIIYRARFKQLRAYYTRPAANTPHPNLPQVYFVDDVDFQDKLAGMIEWTRVYATCPTSWNDFSSTAYTFPGLAGTRVPIARTVTEKIVQDYFLVGNLATFTANLAAYDDFSNASWSKTNVSGTANAGTIPACAGESLVAAKIYEDNTNTLHLISQASDAPAGITFGTIFLKRAGRTRAYVTLGESPIYASAVVDLDNSNITQISGTNATLAAIGDGWWRVGMSGNATSANASLRVFVLNDTAGPNTSLAYLGDGASGMFMWRGQVGNGSLPHATVPPTLTPDGTNYPVPNADNFPVKFGTQYVYAWSQNVAAEYLDGSTVPNLNTYNTWVANDAANGNSNSYSIESTDSTLSLWQGSIWQRQRHFVKAR